jgi:hypothetical protein
MIKKIDLAVLGRRASFGDILSGEKQFEALHIHHTLCW